MLVSAAGFVLMVAAVIWSNEAVNKMAKLVRLPFEVGMHSSTTDRQAWSAIREYRARFGNGPLLLSFIAALMTFAIGGIMFVVRK